MTAFTNLNEVVNKIFFDGRFEAVPVYLDLEDTEKKELSISLGIEAADLDEWVGSAVLETLDFNKSNIYKVHSQALAEWLDDGLQTPPPFTALLLLFSMAAERMRKGDKYSANNYYQRLFAILKIDDETKQTKVRVAGKDTEQFWRALNRWLTEYDYAFGRPTAKQVNKWRYVSYALSQSLVRDGDRRLFHRMFANFGLSPHEKLSESEMTPYLHDWMGSHGPSAWLKTLWATTDLRPRVAGSAVYELERWDGISDVSGEARATYKRLGWVAIVHPFPTMKVKFHLATNANVSGGTRLQVSERSSEVVLRSMAGVDSLWFADLPGTDLVALAPPEKIQLAALFLDSIELVESSTSVSYRHDAKPIKTFVKDGSGSHYREILRVSLHSKHLILCHANWQGEVQSYLKDHARSGFVCMIGTNSNGLPSDWCLFQQVEFSVIPQGEVSEKVQCLVPLPVGPSIHLSGGLKLAYNIWHASEPPEIMVSDDRVLLDAQLITDDLNADAKVICETTTTGFDSSFIYKCRSELNSQNLKIVGLRNSKVLVGTEVSFRTAQTPRRIAISDESSYAYPLNMLTSGIWGTSATLSTDIPVGTCVLKGMTLAGELPAALMAIPAELDITIKVSHTEDVETLDYKMGSVEGGAETCTLRGYHIRVCPPYLGGDRKKVSRITECKDCSELKILQNKSGQGKRKKLNPLEQNAISVNIAESTDRSVSPDSAFDAICYLGSGTWNSLESILSTIVSVHWEISEAAKNLVDLGLIDVELDNSGRKSSHWSCPPPAMVLAPDGTAYLAGFRDSSIVGEIMRRMNELPVQYKVCKQPFAPLRHAWELGSISISDIREQLADVADPLGRSLRVVESPGAVIIGQMPSINEIKQRLNPIHIEDNSDIEKFDVSTGRWHSAHLGQTGSYRTKFCGRRYFHIDATGRMLETGFELAKVFAARDQNLRLHGYNEKSTAFECVVGCQPPGILRRALVSYSGMLPELLNGRHIYKNVPKEIASQLITKLYK